MAALVATLPWLSLVILTVGCFVCYAIAILHGHVSATPYWPFVSSVGTQTPESCLFTMTVIWAGFTACISTTLFYSYVRAIGSHSKLNNACLGCGIIGFVGCTFVGSFQLTELLYPHMFGTILVFAGFGFYSWMATLVTWRDLKKSTPTWLLAYRILNTVVLTLVVILFIIFFNLREASIDYFRTATSLEWVALFINIIFITTLSYELRGIRLVGSFVELNGPVSSENRTHEPAIIENIPEVVHNEDRDVSIRDG